MALSRRRFAAALAGLAGSFPTRLPALRPRPKLFVFMVAEQFRQVYLERAAGLLSPGGFRELMAHGVYYSNCNLSASGFTASGLATLATGAYPQVHGIVAERWFDRKTGAVAKARGGLLEATTLADEAVRLDHTRIFCLGMDEGFTSILAGHSAAPVFWMDPQTGQYNTRGNIPEWLDGFNLARPATAYHDHKWSAIGARPDTPALRTLTFDPKRPEEFMALYLSSPLAQAKQSELLLTLLAEERLGQRDTLDFVFLSLGSMARLGHETGSDHPLMDQMAAQLDGQVQRVLETLNRTPGKNNYNLIFAAAHGALPDPGAALHSQMPISSESVARAIGMGLSDWFDRGATRHTYVEKYIYPFLYLKTDLLRTHNVALHVARKLAGEIALRLPGVAGYYTADGECSHTGEWRRRFENSFNELRSGDVMLAYVPGAVEDFNAGRGVSYGSLYNYDTRVPLFLYGPQFGRKQIERVVEAVDLAPTVARAALLGPPSSATGGVLAEAFADFAEDDRPR